MELESWWLRSFWYLLVILARDGKGGEEWFDLGGGLFALFGLPVAGFSSASLFGVVMPTDGGVNIFTKKRIRGRTQI